MNCQNCGVSVVKTSSIFCLTCGYNWTLKPILGNKLSWLDNESKVNIKKDEILFGFRFCLYCGKSDCDGKCKK